MRRTINNVVSVIYSFCRIILFKMLKGSSFTSGLIERISPNVVLEFNKKSKVHLGDRVRIHSGGKIKVRSKAELYIGNDVKINYNCIIACHEKISIGEGTEFGPSVYLYDHDHDFRAGLKNDKYKTAPITIGKNCWIGANTIILRGSVIGDNCVIAAGSIVTGEIPENKILIQKRESVISSVVD